MKGRDYGISAVERACDVLLAFDGENTEWTLTSLSERLGLPKSSVFRVLATLEAKEFVEKHPTAGKYRLGRQLVRIGSLSLVALKLREVARPLLQELVEAFRETVSLARFTGGQLLYVEVLESPHPLRTTAQIGDRAKLHCSALGKAVIAHLSSPDLEEIVRVHGLPRATPNTIVTLAELEKELVTVRKRRYAVDNQENELGIRCVGAAVFDHEGKPIGGVSISAPVTRFTPDKVECLGEGLLKTTLTISRGLGYSGD